MKQRYLNPEIEIIELSSTDIITSSNCPTESEIIPFCPDDDD